MHRIDQAAGMYRRLIILVAAAGVGKTAVLQRVHERIGAPLINVNLELSRRMLNLTVRQRALQLSWHLGEIVGEAAGELALLDNFEILFDVRLKQDPLLLLQGMSRNKTVVAAWNGSMVDDHLTCAAPEHPEYLAPFSKFYGHHRREAGYHVA